MRLVVKAGFHGDLRERKLSRFGECHRMLHTLAKHVLMWCHANGRAELPGEVKGAHVRHLGERRQRHLVTNVSMNEIHYGAELAGAQLATRYQALGPGDGIGRNKVQREANR